MSAYLKEQNGVLYLTVVASPYANQTKAIEEYGNALKIRVAAVPEKGEANEELRAYLVGVLGLANYEVKLIQGGGSSQKLFRIEHISASDAEERLQREMKNSK